MVIFEIYGIYTHFLLENVHATSTHLILGRVGFHRLSNIIDSSMITTARRRTITTPTNMPPISPALADALSPVLVSLGGGGGGLAVVASSGFLLVGLVSGAPVVVVIGGDTNGQSGDLRVSREVGQEASRCSREDDWIAIEALPLPTQDCIRVTRPGALYTSVPTILALYTMKLVSWPRQLNSSFLIFASVRRQVGQRCISSTVSPLRTWYNFSVLFPVRSYKEYTWETINDMLA